jgi:hypothetical protein
MQVKACFALKEPPACGTIRLAEFDSLVVSVKHMLLKKSGRPMFLVADGAVRPASFDDFFVLRLFWVQDSRHHR